MKDWVIYSLLCLLFNSIWGILSKIATSYIKPQHAIVYETIGIAMVAIYIASQQKFQLETSPQGIVYCIIVGIVGIISSLFYFIAINKGNLATVTFIAALYPNFVLLFSVLFLKEQINIQQWIAIFFAFLSITLFTLS